MFFVVVPALTSSGSDPEAKSSRTASESASASEPAKQVEAIPGAPSRSTIDGGFALGADGEAGVENPGAVRVDLYVDYMCPLCAQFEEINIAALDEARINGDITFVVHPVTILDRFSQGTRYSTRAAAAAAYVAENAPSTFADFSAGLMTNQPEEGSTGLTDAEIADVASSAGVPDEVATAIEDGTAADTYAQWALDATSAAANDTSVASSQGFGTPTLLIDGERFEQNWMDPSAVPAAIEEATA